MENLPAAGTSVMLAPAWQLAGGEAHDAGLGHQPARGIRALHQ